MYDYEYGESIDFELDKNQKLDGVSADMTDKRFIDFCIIVATLNQ